LTLVAFRSIVCVHASPSTNRSTVYVYDEGEVSVIV